MKLTIEDGTLLSAEQEPDERELTVPDGVKAIARGGLAHLPLIERIALPDSVRSIGRFAFVGDVSLRELTFPLTATLEDGALLLGVGDDVKALRMDRLTLTVPADKAGATATKALGKRLESLLSPERVVFGPGLARIPDDVFPYFFPDVRSIEFGDGLREIGVDNFKGLKRLTEVVFPETLGFIERRAFDGCSLLHEVSVPEGCRVSVGAFQRCGVFRNGKKLPAPEFAVRRMRVAAGEALALPGVQMETRGNMLLSTTADESVREIAVPEGIEVVGQEALAHLPRVKRILLPDSVKEIRARAFADNPRLTELAVPVLAKLDGDAFRGIRAGDKGKLDCLTLTVPKGKRIKQLRSENRDEIFAPFKRLVFQAGIESIADWGAPNLYRDVLTIEFGEGLRAIGRRNFALGFSLKEIAFPSTLESIGANAFSSFALLHEVRVPERCQIDPKAFQRCGIREHGRELPAPRFEIIRE